MRITTLNLQGYFDWQERQDDIIDYVQSTTPDIILFQEAVFLPSISYLSQPAILNQTLNYTYEHISIPRLQDSPHFPEYREGLAVLSNLPAIKSEVITLKKQPEDNHQRIVQFLDIAQADAIIKIANVHFSVSDVFSKLQLEELFEILDARNETRIIAGDFNMPDLDMYSSLWSHAYTATTAQDYISFPAEDKRIDYFLIPKKYSLENIEISRDGLSDHRAVSIDLRC